LKFYRDKPRTLTVTAQLRPDGKDLVATCRLSADRTLKGSDTPQHTVHFTGSVRLSKQAAAPQTEPPVVRADGGPSVSHEDVYRLYFHGPAYRVVAEGWQDSGAAVAQLAADLPPNHEPADLPTVLTPRLLELCFQSAGLWDAGRTGLLALPGHVDRVLVYDAAAEATGAGPVVAVARALADGDTSGQGFDCLVLDGAGHVILRVEGYGTVPMPGTLPDEIRAPFQAMMSHVDVVP
jgi:hypothetical protein